jgi:hypothetical protein
MRGSSTPRSRSGRQRQPMAPIKSEGGMGSSRSISSHCDPKTLAAIDHAFDGAWSVLETRDLLARFASDYELQEELSQRLMVLASDGVTDREELRRQALASFPLAKGLSRPLGRAAISADLAGPRLG